MERTFVSVQGTQQQMSDNFDNCAMRQSLSKPRALMNVQSEPAVFQYNCTTSRLQPLDSKSAKKVEDKWIMIYYYLQSPNKPARKLHQAGLLQPTVSMPHLTANLRRH